ncbi:lytic transglycosylase domain-containing protein [Oricola thermophila]|uniref:Lytic transglycosylase domain-containing protein n=1 Tax=Oricola thermophila TaxID=2742145 RepID=A0A6N1VGD3_9HYPH|nr:lytic transglycosylase domain-containing protein [Oricola thermophila]QKV19848.1 lytic transglycosylase domain-containing protein [Oricola thermophila]
MRRGPTGFVRAAALLLLIVFPAAAQDRDVRVVLPLQLDAKPTDDFERIAPDRAKPVDTNRICELVEAAATENNLPPAFLARVIWKESRFDPGHVSRTGERGISQFGPGLAFERGLRDSFDAAEAIPALAAYLAELRDRFGNIGLAAAAWDAGEGQVTRWLEKGGFLPIRTEDYLLAVLGELPIVYRGTGTEIAVPPLQQGRTFAESCPDIPRLGDAILLSDADRPAWGAQVAGHFNRENALKQWTLLKERHPRLLDGLEPAIFGARSHLGRNRIHVVQIPAESRAEAAAFCARMRAAGEACVVTRN